MVLQTGFSFIYWQIKFTDVNDYTLATGVILCSHEVLSMIKSLHIEFDEFKGNVIIPW